MSDLFEALVLVAAFKAHSNRKLSFDQRIAVDLFVQWCPAILARWRLSAKMGAVWN